MTDFAAGWHAFWRVFSVGWLHAMGFMSGIVVFYAIGFVAVAVWRVAVDEWRYRIQKR